MNPSCAPRGSLLGLLLILAGALLFLDNIGLLPIAKVEVFWPVSLIAVGIFAVDRRRTLIAMIWGGALIFCGILITLGNLRIIHVTAAIIGPVMLIAFGLTMLVHPPPLRQWIQSHKHENFHFAPPRMNRRYAEFRRQSQEKQSDGKSQNNEKTMGATAGWGRQNFHGNRLNEAIVFSSINRRMETRSFEGGKLDVVFGSIDLDLSGAAISSPDRHAAIEANAVFGGIEITVPRTWKVIMRSHAAFGGCDNRTVPPRPEPGVTPETLVITGGAVFSGITVRN